MGRTIVKAATATGSAALLANAADRGYTRTVLDGVRVLAAPMRERASVSIAFMFGTGSRVETADECGLAHFIEHMVFKGGEMYPTARRISEAVEGVGGALNASTDREATIFWAKVPAERTRRRGVACSATCCSRRASFPRTSTASGRW